MKKYLIVSAVAGIMLLAGLGQAQQRPSKEKVVFKGKTYLKGGQIGSGTVSKKDLVSLLQDGPVVRDSLGKEHAVILFTFTYAERGVFEDSTGRPVIMTDYYSIESDNGKIPDGWFRLLQQRLKKGDTATFSNVLSFFDDQKRTRFHAEPLKLIVGD